MPEIDYVNWCYILKTKDACVKLGVDEVRCLRAESTDINNQESNSLVKRFENLSFNEREYFISDRTDFNYDPPRESTELHVRNRIEKLGWFDEFELEYLLSPPNEKYIGPGSKEYEENERLIEQEVKEGRCTKINEVAF